MECIPVEIRMLKSKDLFSPHIIGTTCDLRDNLWREITYPALVLICVCKLAATPPQMLNLIGCLCRKTDDEFYGYNRSNEILS